MLIRDQVDLAPYNTFGLQVRAEHYAEASTIDDIRTAARARSGIAFVLGGGSNVVLTRDIAGLVLRIALRGRRLAGEDDYARYVRVAAGEPWHELVLWTLDQGWGGLENLSLIPGTAGAAPIQNIGAYGVEIESVFESLEALDLATGESCTFDAKACAFGYRDSVFKRAAAGHYVITSLLLRLPKRWQARIAYRELADELEARAIPAPSPRDVSDAVIAIRTRKLPDWHTIGNAGSFFKNPIVDASAYAALRATHPTLPSYAQTDGSFKLAAGWLIDQVGWKGRCLGRAGVYSRQALILTNNGGASGAEIMALADAIRADVRTRFGIALEPEPVVV